MRKKSEQDVLLKLLILKFQLNIYHKILIEFINCHGSKNPLTYGNMIGKTGIIV